MILDKRKRYLQVALNGSPGQAREIISHLPLSDRILIEAGTPLIKIYGKRMITMIGAEAPGSYVVADTKCADLAQREVRAMADAGASAVTCLGVAPVETIDLFISECQKAGVDSMIDMMNVDNPVEILKRLNESPDVVILHRGVDETEFSKDKQIPYYQINQIKDNFDVMVSVAGGDAIDEIQKAILSGADIVVVWKAFYQSTGDAAELAEEFLKEIR
jgi:bifunctional enzyme Fae/Hps